jgi:hypothetical protein
MRYLIVLLISISVLSLTSCRKDFDFEPSNGELKFSKDTVYLDTVFTNIGSSTYTLKVYNKSNKDIKIPTIRLGKGLESKYRITVDGMTGENNRIFHDVELLAKDSMYVFIEVTADVADANPTDFLYTDQILFDDGSNQQKVELVTLIQDAYFLYPKRFDNGTTETLLIGDDEVYGFYLDENDPVNGNEYIWGNDKPYVVYGYAAVPNGKTLSVMPGARIHFHDSSGLIIDNGGSLKVNGQTSTTLALENEVIFEGDRLEPGFSDVPGQWGTIWLTDGSTGNEIKNLTIKNATIGLLIDHNDGNYMTIKNTQIYNSSNIGIYAKNAKIKGENIAINYGGVAALACTLGGNYEFKHCTFNNNWPSSKQVSVLINDYFRDNTGMYFYQSLETHFTNCIIYGGNNVEFSLERRGTEVFTYDFKHCIIKFNNSQLSGTGLYNFSNVINYDTCFISNNALLYDPRFKNVSANQLNLLEGSSAIGNGIYEPLVPKDILGVTRPLSPDIGAYQFNN